MRRVTHDTWASILGVLYLGLMVNLLVLTASLPLVVLLITTDPVHSWPLLALAAPLAAPALAAAFGTFRAHDEGETQVVRAFVRAWRRTARPSLLLGTAAVAAIVVLLVDVRMLAATAASVLVVPLLLVLAVLTAATALLALAAVAEVPRARLRDAVRAAFVLAVRRWPLQVLSLVVLAVQVAVFATMPAVGIGLTAAPVLYVAWANSRHALRPVLGIEDAPAR